LYQATPRPERRAKSVASIVLPVPARPATMVELQPSMLSFSVSSRRSRETRGSSAGGVIFSGMTCAM
jgi:hypothetical protein